MYAYDKCYISDAQNVVGNMLDYVVGCLKIKLEKFWRMFLNSTISRKIAFGDAACLAGNSGVELAWKVLDESVEYYMGDKDTIISNQRDGSDKKTINDQNNHCIQTDVTVSEMDYRSIKPAFTTGRSREYWTGWSLTYYQWRTGISFQQIDNEIPILLIVDMYDKYHEMDPEHFCEEMFRISQTKRIYTYAKLYRQRLGISQREAAEEAGIPVRTLQQYEQRQKNINKASAETIIHLARVYGVRPEDLMEPDFFKPQS